MDLPVQGRSAGCPCIRCRSLGGVQGSWQGGVPLGATYLTVAIPFANADRPHQPVEQPDVPISLGAPQMIGYPPPRSSARHFANTPRRRDTDLAASCGCVHSDPMDRSEALEARISDLESRLDDLRRQIRAESGATTPQASSAGAFEESTGRRTFVRRAGAVAAATVA